MNMENEARGNVLQRIIDMMDDDIKEKMKKHKGKGHMQFSMTIIGGGNKDKLNSLREKLMGYKEE